MMVTKKDLEYNIASYGHIAVVPKGTKVIPATNLPGPDVGFWAEFWEGMSEKAESWKRNYGFHVSSRDIKEV